MLTFGALLNDRECYNGIQPPRQSLCFSLHTCLQFIRAVAQKSATGMARQHRIVGKGTRQIANWYRRWFADIDLQSSLESCGQ
jgi:hypothetical protein